MSLDVIKEYAKVNRLVGEESARTVIENDIIVPDVKPDISKILLLNGDVIVNSTEALQDRLVINGLINFKILYLADEFNRTVKSINTSASFTYGLDVEGFKKGVRCNVKCDIEHIEYEILNERKLNVKTFLNIRSKGYEEQQLEIISDLRGIDNIQVLKENININDYLGTNEARINITEEFEIPAGKPTIKDILFSDVFIKRKEFKLTENKVVAEGELNISTLYVADNREQSIEFMEQGVPFTQVLELDGVNEDAICIMEYDILNFQTEPLEDSDGELRNLRGEFSIGLSASAYCTRSELVISDGYCRDTNLIFEKETFETKQITAERRSQLTLKDELQFDEQDPEISEVFHVISKPYLSEYMIKDGKLIVEGVVNNSLIYLTNDAEMPLNCIKHEIPFKQSVDIEHFNEVDCEIDIETECCDYSMKSSNEVELRVVLGVNARFLSGVTHNLTTNVNEDPFEDKRCVEMPSIVIYFTQPGDTLWKIAKRYRISIEDIRVVNDLDLNDNIVVGQQIVIPKK